MEEGEQQEVTKIIVTHNRLYVDKQAKVRGEECPGS